MYDIIENTADFVVIYKKPDASFHSESSAPGLFETLRGREGFPELFPVHRLDKVTSGLMVMAKNAETNRALVTAFALREVDKFYLAISAKKPLKKQGLVKGDMAPARRGAWKLLPTTENPAVTQFFSKAFAEGGRIFLLRPRTGKTHQLRVALKSLGAPILGDALYSGALTLGHQPADRTYLHAFSIAFRLGERAYRFTALPREGVWFTAPQFLSAIDDWQNPETLLWPSYRGNA